MAKDKKFLPDSKTTMAKKALKEGVKSALRTAGAGGMIDSAASTMKKEAKKTKKASE